MKILLALPSYDGNAATLRDLRAFEAGRRLKCVDAMSSESSFLTYNFNVLWCKALNDRSYTHFVLLHADLVPKRDDWLERLIDLANNADVLSAVSPLKMDTGGTSTALAKVGEFGNYRRLTIREARGLPDTFGRKDVARLFGWDWSESVLLTNTGMMVVNLRKRDILETMCFTTQNWIRKEEGKFIAVSEPEDWNFSRIAQEKSLNVRATCAVPLTHKGACNYDNDRSWGQEHEEGT